MKVYDWQTKKKIVLEYINTDISYRALAKKHNVNGNSQIREWVNMYREYGEEGLINRNRSEYTKEFKLQLVEEYLNTKKGYKKIAKEYGLKSRNQLRDWVLANTNNSEKSHSIEKGMIVIRKILN